MTAVHKKLSPQQYLAREERSEQRSEYVDGDVIAMVGASLAHNRIARNLVTRLTSALKRRPCDVFMSDVKLHVERANAYFYPDVMVSCGPSRPGDAISISDANLVIEVLSPSTERHDRELKLEAYGELASLREYVLVASDRRRVELFRRGKDLGWHYQAFDRVGTLSLESVGVKLTLRSIYERSGVR